MRGFVLRELLLLRVYLPVAAVSAVVAVALSFAIGTPLPMFAALIMAVPAIPLLLAARDERSGWSALSRTMPARTGAAVLSRYFSALLFAALAFAVSLGAEALRESLQPERIPPAGSRILPVALLLGIFTLSLTLPVAERWGARRAAIAAAVLSLLSAGMIGALFILLAGNGELSFAVAARLSSALDAVGGSAILTLLLSACAVVMLSASCMLSVSIREKREY